MRTRPLVDIFENRFSAPLETLRNVNELPKSESLLIC